MSSVQSLSGKERKELIEETQQYIKNIEEYLPKKGKTSKYYNDKDQIGFVANHEDLILIKMDDIIIPSLKLAQNAKLEVPKIVVDKGAIRFVTNGADIMRPGIVHIDDDVVEGNLVIVTEEMNDAPLCFGISLYDAVDMKEMENGRVVTNLHYLSDDWWEFSPK